MLARTHTRHSGGTKAHLGCGNGSRDEAELLFARTLRSKCRSRIGWRARSRCRHSSAVLGLIRLIVRLSCLHRALQRPSRTTMVAAPATLHGCAGSGGGNTGRRRQARGIASLVESHARCYAVGVRESAAFRGKMNSTARTRVLGDGVCTLSMLFSRVVVSPRHSVYRFISGSTRSILIGWRSFFCFLILRGRRK